MSGQRILVIDDEPDIRELLELTLVRMGLKVTTAASVAEARKALARKRFDLCLTDMKLPDGNGLDLVREISHQHPQLPAAVITAYGKVEDAVTALKAGAFDFVSKPVNLADLRNLVNSALNLSTLQGGKNAGQQHQEERHGIRSLIGDSAEIENVRQMIAKLARNQAPVMITGGSGSGKELAAGLIHQLGPRSDAPFIPVNCGAIPSELMESEFFGHRKGSFTGAEQDKHGLFQAAHGGTLFLDEVADLPLHMQVKLLRAIQEKAIRPIGAQQEISVDVRILSATHKPLKPLLESGSFRNDLYFRINVIELQMPELHQRKQDIPMLAKHFVREIAEQWGLDKIPRLSGEALEVLQKHHYSGNVRELINILQRAITLSSDDSISAADLQLEPGDTIEPPQPDQSWPAYDSLDQHLAQIEARELKHALQACKGNKTAAAEMLGISFRSIRYKLQKYGID